jgi:hypothetical protein
MDTIIDSNPQYVDANVSKLITAEEPGQNPLRERYVLTELASAKQGSSSEPKRSLAQWAQAYEVKTNADRSVSYHRDGQERFIDRLLAIPETCMPASLEQ